MATPTMTPTITPTPTMMNNGRDKINWTQDIWDRIDKAVHDEVMRTRVAAKFLPIRPVLAKTVSVPSDLITPPANSTAAHSVDEGATTRLNEYWVEFSLTPQQIEHETGNMDELGHSTAVTLATRAANILAQAEDLVIFQGQNAINDPDPKSLFKSTVHNRGLPTDSGLLNLDSQLNPLIDPSTSIPFVQGVTVLPIDPAKPGIYGENTFGKVAEAYAELQGNGQYGPYALVLQTIPYADSYAPLATTLIMPADRIKALMTAGFFGTGTLPSNPNPANTEPRSFGVVVSLGGNTMDLVVGLDATTTFMQQDTDGNYRFRVVERFGLRLKDTSGVIILGFA